MLTEHTYKVLSATHYMVWYREGNHLPHPYFNYVSLSIRLENHPLLVEGSRR